MTNITLWKKRKGKLSSIVLQTSAMEFTSRSNKKVCSMMCYLLAAHFELYASLNCKKLEKYYNRIASVYCSSMEMLLENNRIITIFLSLAMVWQKLNLNVIQRKISSFLVHKEVQEMDIVFKKQYSIWIWERYSGDEPSHLLPGPFLTSMSQPRYFIPH